MKYVAIFMFLVFNTLSAVTQSKQVDDQSEVKSGTIKGKVVNETGQPLYDAAVSIRTFGSGGIYRETTTDRDGTFQFNGLSPVVYLLSASLPAYTPAPRDPDTTQATSYRVGDSATLVLIKGGVVTGKVTSSSGEPIVVVRVRAQMIRDANGQRTHYGATLRESITDDRGVYRVYGLPAGTYLIFAGAGNGFGGSNSYSNDSPTYSPSSTRDTAAEINVKAGVETPDVDIRYRGEPGHVVTGIASGPPGSDVTTSSITLTSTLDAGSQWSETTFQTPRIRGFSFFGVADGDYDVTALSYLPNGERAISTAKRIKVRGSDVTGLELVAQPLASINGRVVLEGSDAAECKGKRRALVTETLISAWHNEKEAPKDQPQFVWGLGGPIYPNQQGEFTLRNLAPGQYQIITRLFAKYWYLRSITLPSTSSQGQAALQTSRSIDAVSNWTTVRQTDRLSGMVVTLSEGAGSLQGQITSNTAETLPNRPYVYLVPIDAERAKDVLRFFAAPVSADRKFTLNHIPPGRYWIMLQPALEGTLPPLTKLRLPDEVEARAKLRRDAEAAKIEVELKPCQNMTDYELPIKP